jgi:hypothetical protein
LSGLSRSGHGDRSEIAVAGSIFCKAQHQRAVFEDAWGMIGGSIAGRGLEGRVIPYPGEKLGCSFGSSSKLLKLT